MEKQSTSLRTLGQTFIAVDKPLRADIKAEAAKRGLTMVEYLREKVAEDKSKKIQGLMMPNSGPVTKGDLAAFRAEMHRFAAVLMLLPFSPMLAEPGEFDKVRDNLAGGMGEIEGLMASKLSELPADALAIARRVFSRAEEINKQGEMVLE